VKLPYAFFCRMSNIIIHLAQVVEQLRVLVMFQSSQKTEIWRQVERLSVSKKGLYLNMQLIIIKRLETKALS
jgi:hypothetical protein